MPRCVCQLSFHVHVSPRVAHPQAADGALHLHLAPDTFVRERLLFKPAFFTHVFGWPAAPASAPAGRSSAAKPAVTKQVHQRSLGDEEGSVEERSSSEDEDSESEEDSSSSEEEDSEEEGSDDEQSNSDAEEGSSDQHPPPLLLATPNGAPPDSSLQSACAVQQACRMGGACTAARIPHSAPPS